MVIGDLPAPASMSAEADEPAADEPASDEPTKKKPAPEKSAGKEKTDGAV